MAFDAEGHRHTPSQLSRTLSGLGIVGESNLSRQQSHQALIENAAEFSHAADSTVADSTSPPQGWNVHFAGPVEGGFSPFSSPRSGDLHADGLRDSIHSAWDKGAKRAARRNLDDERDLGSRKTEETEYDAMSLDSLQMHEHDDDEPPQHRMGNDDLPAYATAYTTTRDIGSDEEQAFRSGSDGATLRKMPPSSVHIERLSWPAIWLLIMSVYSTIGSGLWLVIAIMEPRWGGTISTNGPMALSTAGVVVAIIAKTIEMAFVTVVVAFIGQVLTRRAIATHGGMTMAEMAMRSWITQPGTLVQNFRILPYAARTLLGIVTILSTIVVMFYTTASDTMLRPKLQFSRWEHTYLNSTISASYANTKYVNEICTTPITIEMDPKSAGDTCLGVQYSGSSFSDMLTFMSTWRDTENASLDMAKRPQVQSMLYDNVTMVGTWIETQFSDVSANYVAHDRIINNVSLAMPHPGVLKAATNKTLNGILQPSDLDGVGSYNVSASVISPAINVLCVNMNRDELAPIVYTEWPNASTSDTGFGNQTMGEPTWQADIPFTYLNATVVDDIFGWGELYGRYPPVFQGLPVEYNTIVNYSSIYGTSDAFYVLAKSPRIDDYTVCALRSWPAIQCSTRFNVSGLTSMAMSADCSQDVDYYWENRTLLTSNPDAYVHTMGNGTIAASKDWLDLIQNWIFAIGLNGGVESANASNARILTQLALTTPHLNTSIPSIAETLAAMAANSLIIGAINTPFIHFWNYTESILTEPAMVQFPARVRSQEYASWHTEPWQGIFYVVLGLCFALNVLCLGYLCRWGLVKDFLEPTSLFALATARAARGSGGVGEAGAEMREPLLAAAASPGMAKTPEMERKERKKGMVAPWRLSYKPDADHFFFEEAGDGGQGHGNASGVELTEGVVGKKRSYVKLGSTPFL